jgi:hypothetical protein
VPDCLRCTTHQDLARAVVLAATPHYELEGHCSGVRAAAAAILSAAGAAVTAAAGAVRLWHWCWSQQCCWCTALALLQQAAVLALKVFIQGERTGAAIIVIVLAAIISTSCACSILLLQAVTLSPTAPPLPPLSITITASLTHAALIIIIIIALVIVTVIIIIIFVNCWQTGSCSGCLGEGQRGVLCYRYVTLC